jgi:hypothetical protein
MDGGRGFWGRIFQYFCYYFLLRSETDLDQKSLESRDCLGSCGLAKKDQNMGSKCHTLDVIYVYGLALIAWT